MTDKTEELLEKLVAQGDANRRRSSNAGPADSGGGFGLLGDTAKTVGGALNDLWRGSMNLSNGLDSFTGLISRHGGDLGNAFGKLTNQIGSAILDTTASLNKSSQYGADFNMDIAEYDKLLKGARMTHEQYNDFIKHSSQDLAGLGGGINKAQKNFLDIARDFQESGIGAKFKELGWSTDELNELTKTAMQNRKGVDMSSPENQRAALLATQKLAMAMDENSRILGISRKEQMAELTKRQEDARLEATYQSMDPEARARFEQMMAENQGMGENWKRAVKEAFTGKITEEGSQSLAALGTGAADVTKLGISLRQGGTEAEQRSTELGEKSRASTLDWMGSEGYKAGVRYADGAVADKMGQELTSTKLLGVVQTKKAEAETEGRKLDTTAALKELDTAATNRQAGLKENGEALDTAGANVATTVNKLDRALGDMFAGSHEVFGKLVGKTDDLANGFQGLNDILKPHTQKQMNPSAMIENAGEHILKNVPGIKSAYEAGKSSGNLSPEQMAKPVEPVKRAGGSPELTDFLSSTTASFSSMFEHFDPAGVPAELHGNEVVATEAQMMQLVQKLVPDNFANLAKQTSTPAPVANEIKLPTLPNLPTNKPEETKTAESKVTQPIFSPKFEDELVKTVNSTIANVFTQALAPIKNMAAAKPADVKPVEVKKPDVKPEVKPAETKPAEVKPVDMHLEKVHDVVKSIENTTKNPENKDANAIIQSKLDAMYKKWDTEIVPHTAQVTNKEKPVDEANKGKPEDNTTGQAEPKKDESKLKDPRDEFTNAEMTELETGRLSAETIKRNDRDSTNKFLIDKIAEMKGRTDEDAEHDLPILEAQYAEFKPKYDAENAAAAKQRQLTLAAEKKQRDIEEGKAVEPKLPEVLPNPATNITDLAQPKETEAADKLKSQAASVLDSVKSSFEATKPESEAAPVEKPAEEPSFFDDVTSTFSDIGSSIAGVFKEDNSPLFARGNVKYETIPPEELAAMEKKSQESIGKIDNSPEAIEAQRAELDRQKNSGLYKQKEPEKAPKADIKPPVPQTKEDAQVADMYKKFGIERFSDYNARLAAEEKAKKVQPVKAAEVKTPTAPTIKQPDLKPPVITGSSLKPPPAPAPAPHVEEKKPEEQPRPAPAVVEKQVSLKDILEAVTKLNTVMTQMAQHTDRISANSHKQIRATESLSNSRF